MLRYRPSSSECIKIPTVNPIPNLSSRDKVPMTGNILVNQNLVPFPARLNSFLLGDDTVPSFLDQKALKFALLIVLNRNLSAFVQVVPIPFKFR